MTRFFAVLSYSNRKLPMVWQWRTAAMSREEAERFVKNWKLGLRECDGWSWEIKEFEEPT